MQPPQRRIAALGATNRARTDRHAGASQSQNASLSLRLFELYPAQGLLVVVVKTEANVDGVCNRFGEAVARRTATGDRTAGKGWLQRFAWSRLQGRCPGSCAGIGLLAFQREPYRTGVLASLSKTVVRDLGAERQVLRALSKRVAAGQLNGCRPDGNGGCCGQP